MTEKLKAPFPWFGGKSQAAELIWSRFGNVANYVEPFFGSGAVMLDRPPEAKIETINDLDCMVANFLRALKPDPFFLPESVERIRTGGFDDDLGDLAGADWIIEAVIEQADVKHALLERVDKIRRPGAI